MTEAPELPIFIVEGANWTVEIQLDEKGIDGLDVAGQILESATRACEMILKYKDKDPAGEPVPESERIVREMDHSFALAAGASTPFVGALLFVHPKGEDPNRAQALIPAYIPLADGGFYMDSTEAKRVLELEDKEGTFLKIAMRILFGDEMKTREAKDEAAVKNLEQLQADLNKSKTEEKPKPDLGPEPPKPTKRKPRKKKNDGGDII
jgi:hypothetical protein